ncbi:hypothetical protein [Alteribacter populi]|uniref:hypothetical protein n=1 Tax=Alteribacter populi TaxID=2011011 RepID=UPI0012FE19FE|nr:hypothetical protein [Alteribacter populi]
MNKRRERVWSNVGDDADFVDASCSTEAVARLVEWPLSLKKNLLMEYFKRKG